MRIVALILVVSLALPAVIATVVAIKDYFDDDPVQEQGDAIARQGIPPFDAVGFRVGGNPRDFCALLASSPVAQQQGMQNRSTLGGYDAMIFAFDTDTQTQFINHFVPIDLDIGWYNANGTLVDFTTMEKCPEGVDCPTYAARGPYRYAVETPAGGLSALGLTASGATLTVGGGC